MLDSEKLTKLRRLFFSKQFLKYVVIGVSGALVDFGLLFIQIYILKFNPFFQVHIGAFEINISGANAISAFTAIVFSFIFQRSWAFKAKDGAVMGQVYRYIGAVTFTYIYTNILFGFLVQNIGITEMLSKLLVTFIQMVTSYLLYKFIVFRK